MVTADRYPCQLRGDVRLLWTYLLAPWSFYVESTPLRLALSASNALSRPSSARLHVPDRALIQPRRQPLRSRRFRSALCCSKSFWGVLRLIDTVLARLEPSLVLPSLVLVSSTGNLGKAGFEACCASAIAPSGHSPTYLPEMLLDVDDADDFVASATRRSAVSVVSYSGGRAVLSWSSCHL